MEWGCIGFRSREWILTNNKMRGMRVEDSMLDQNFSTQLHPSASMESITFIIKFSAHIDP